MENVPFLILIAQAVLLFVLPARQRKRIQAQQQEMQNSLAIGTRVMPPSGLHGTVAGLPAPPVDLPIAPGVVVTFARQAILEIRKPVAAPGSTATDEGTADGRPADGTL